MNGWDILAVIGFFACIFVFAWGMAWLDSQAFMYKSRSINKAAMYYVIAIFIAGCAAIVYLLFS